MIVKNPASNAVELIIKGFSDANGGNVVTINLLPAIGDQAFVAIKHQFPAFIRNDPSGAAETCDRVDKQIFQASATPFC